MAGVDFELNWIWPEKHESSSANPLQQEATQAAAAPTSIELIHQKNVPSHVGLSREVKYEYLDYKIISYSLNSERAFRPVLGADHGVTHNRGPMEHVEADKATDSYRLVRRIRYTFGRLSDVYWDIWCADRDLHTSKFHYSGLREHMSGPLGHSWADQPGANCDEFRDSSA